MERVELIVVACAALAVRLVWNLALHRPIDFNYSDMQGYLSRADQMFEVRPAGNQLWSVLFPYGTHYFIYGLYALFGRKNAAAVGAGYAVLGAAAVAYTYATAARFCTSRWARRLVGLLLVAYYPWISFGGYALSEMPFGLCVAATAFHGLRLADRGSTRDAWLLGLWFALGTAVRPQILVALVLLGLHAVLRPGAWARRTADLGARVLAPVGIVLVLSAIRLHGLTGQWGLVSTNGPLNFAFGRCHCTRIESKAGRGAGGFFRPPALTALRFYESTHEGSWGRLDPVLGEEFSIKEPLGDGDALNAIALRCIRESGPVRQVRFALTHVALLWFYNTPWPDGSQALQWRIPIIWSCKLHNALLLVPALAGIVLAFRKKRARSMLLALHVWSIIITAMLYFGDTRYRVPYDGLIIVLAAQAYTEVLTFLWRRAKGLFAQPAGA